VPVAPDQIPANVGQVVDSVTPTGHPGGESEPVDRRPPTSLQGRTTDLRTIVSAGTTFSQEFMALATQAGFVPAAGGRVVAPTSQEADVELNAAAPPSSSADYVTPASNLWALLAVGVFLGPALLLAWGARPARRRARRRS